MSEIKTLKEIIVYMVYKRSTKNTYVYESGDPNTIPTIYINKTVFTEVPPKNISIIVKEEK